jgi:hydroxymethylpyrimidine pyrophosphatase-like HAD family hydrolase
MSSESPSVSDCFANSSVLSQLQSQSERGRARTAIFSDIGDTLIAHNLEPRAIADAQRLRRMVDERSWPLIAVSGVEFTDVQQRLADSDIPMTSVVIASVGTVIWVRQVDGTFLKDEAYDRRMQSTNYNRLDIVKKTKAIIKELQPELRIVFQNPKQEERWLKHPTSTYWPYKVSLHYLSSPDRAASVASTFGQQFPDFEIVFCEETNFNSHLAPDAPERMYCLDIVPATQADAINYLVERLDITDGFKAGDSGNDVHMLLNSDPLTPILVGGYQPEALATITQRLVTGNKKGPVHRLDDGRSIYIENNHTYHAATSLLRAIRVLSKAT